MEEIIYKSPNNFNNLVFLLNQIKEITIAETWEEEFDAQNRRIHIALHCPINVAVILLEVIMRCNHLEVQILSDDDNPDRLWCILRPSEKPGRFSSIAEMEDELSKELKHSGLLTQNYNKHEMCNFKPDSTKKGLYMNSEKLQILKDFARSIWEERIELFKKEGWENERIKGFPMIGGDEFMGGFYYENHTKFPAIDICGIEWQAWRMKISLHLYDYGKIQVKSLDDIENKPFMYDNIIKTILL